MKRQAFLAILLAALPLSAHADDPPCIVLETRICDACGKSSAACSAFSNISDTDDSCQNAVEAIDGALIKFDTLEAEPRRAAIDALCTALGDPDDDTSARAPLQSIAARSRTGSCDELAQGVCEICGASSTPCTTLKANPGNDATHCGRVLGNIALLSSASDDTETLQRTFCDTLTQTTSTATDDHKTRIPELCAELLATSREPDANLTPQRCSETATVLLDVIQRVLALEAIGESTTALTGDCDTALSRIEKSPCQDHPDILRALEAAGP